MLARNLLAVFLLVVLVAHPAIAQGGAAASAADPEFAPGVQAEAADSSAQLASDLEEDSDSSPGRASEDTADASDNDPDAELARDEQSTFSAAKVKPPASSDISSFRSPTEFPKTKLQSKKGPHTPLLPTPADQDAQLAAASVKREANQFQSRQASNPNKAHASSRARSNISHIDEEEIKLRNQTQKLVKWLRNRLRKRLEDVADLEGELATERIVLTKLSQNINSTSIDRHHEIQLKLKRSKQLKAVTASAHNPEKRLRSVEAEHAELEDRLAAARRAYDALASVHGGLRDRLRQAGLAHWLEARGSEYLPATAIGVLARSAALLDPVANGLHRAYDLDAELAAEVESLVPGLSPDSLIGRSVADLAMLVPLLPLFVILLRTARAAGRTSVAMAAALVASVLAVCAIMALLASVALGKEALGVWQSKHDLAFAGGALIVQMGLVALVALQAGMFLSHPNRAGGSTMVLTVGCLLHVWKRIFVPAMLHEHEQSCVLGNFVLAVALMAVALRCKAVAGVCTPWDESIVLLVQEGMKWMTETGDAMRAVFALPNREGGKRNEESQMIAHEMEEEGMSRTATETGSIMSLTGSVNNGGEFRSREEAGRLYESNGGDGGREGREGRMGAYGAAWDNKRGARVNSGASSSRWRGGRYGLRRFMVRAAGVGAVRRQRREGGSDDESFRSCE